MIRCAVLAVLTLAACAPRVPPPTLAAELPPPVTTPGLERDCLALEGKAEWSGAVSSGLVALTAGAGVASVFGGRELTSAQQLIVGVCTLVFGAGAAVAQDINKHATAGILQCREDAANARLEAVKSQLTAALRSPAPESP